MAITTMDGLVAALAAGQKFDFYKASQTAEGAGTWHSLWKAVGVPAAGANPGALGGVVPTRATTGALGQANAGATILHLLQAMASGATAGKLIIYDRLWANSTMSGTQTVVDTTLGATADAGRYAAGGELWGEIYTAIGATGTTLNVRYTNQAGTTLQVGTYTHPANAESVGQMFPITLAAGDTSCRRPTAYHWTATTGTAGDFGLTVIKRLAEIPMTQINVGLLLDYADLGMPVIEDDACLAFMVLCSATNTGIIQGLLKLGDG